MLSVVARILNPRKRTDTPQRSELATRVRAAAPLIINDDDDRALARSLADALDEAVGLGKAHQTNMIAQSAARIAHRHPQLTERLARLRLRENDADAALHLIEACSERTDSLRLLHIACMLQNGRIVEAHQDLSQWCHHSSAPIEARLLLALLEWEQGDLESASMHLRDNIRAAAAELGDEKTLMLLTCLAIERDNLEHATHWADRLRQTMWRRIGVPDVNVFIHSLNVPSNDTAIAPTVDQLGALATELIAAESAIPAIVEALEIEFDAAAADMLAVGIEHALYDFNAPATALEALARLNILLQRPERAAQWIDLGLAENPLSASLMLLKQSVVIEIEPPQRATGRKRSAAA